MAVTMGINVHSAYIIFAVALLAFQSCRTHGSPLPEKDDMRKRFLFKDFDDFVDKVLSPLSEGLEYVIEPLIEPAKAAMSMYGRRDVDVDNQELVNLLDKRWLFSSWDDFVDKVLSPVSDVLTDVVEPLIEPTKTALQMARDCGCIVGKRADDELSQLSNILNKRWLFSDFDDFRDKVLRPISDLLEIIEPAIEPIKTAVQLAKDGAPMFGKRGETNQGLKDMLESLAPIKAVMEEALRLGVLLGGGPMDHPDNNVINNQL